MQDILEFAKAYIDAGFQVHPCIPPTAPNPKTAGKAPKLKAWEQKRLTLDEFKKLYRPGDNLGVVTGKSSGLVCIDIDPRNGGDGWYEFFKDNLGNPLVEKTGSGGLHLYYKYPKDVEYLQSKKFSDGVDILADGGRQVVTAPSIHACGKPYVIDDFVTLLDIQNEADFLPDWIVKDLSSLAPKEVPSVNGVIFDPSSSVINLTIGLLSSFPLAIQGQGGDIQTLKAASFLRSYGLTLNTAYKVLLEHYNPKCLPPWEPQELRQKVVNAYKYVKEDAGINNPVNQFKVEEKIRKKNGVKTLSLTEFLETNFAPKEHYIGPFVKQGVSLIYAGTGVGKTHFCIGLAFAIASATNFLRWKSEKKAKVLYIDGELPGHYLKSMIKPLYDSLRDKDVHFDIITPDTQEDCVMPDLATLNGQEAVKDSVDNADVIFVDNLSTLVRSGKENEAEYWMPLQSWFLSLRRRGKSVIFCHHSGKGETGSFRGTSKITDAVDLAVFLKAPPGHKPGDGCKFEVHFPKLRHYRKGDGTEFEATYLDTEFALPSWEWKDLEEVNSNKVLELHEAGLSAKDIILESDIPKSTVYRILKNAGVTVRRTKPSKPRKDLDGQDDF